MADIINIIQEPVSDTSPTIEIVQPFIVQTGAYYYGWEFNLVNGENEYTVYQKGVDNDVDLASGASVILGGNNALTGDEALDDVIIIGHHVSANSSNVMVFGRHINVNNNAIYYGEYPSSTVYIGANIIIAAGTSDVPFDAIVAGVDAGQHKYIFLGSSTSDVYVPVEYGGIRDYENQPLATVNIKDIKTAFVERGTDNANYLYGRGTNSYGGYEKKYSVSSNAEDDTVILRDAYGRFKTHVKIDGYDDSSTEDNSSDLYVPNLAYMSSQMSLKVNKTSTIAGIQIGSGIDSDALTTHLVYCSNEGIDELFE